MNSRLVSKCLELNHHNAWDIFIYSIKIFLMNWNDMIGIFPKVLDGASRMYIPVKISRLRNLFSLVWKLNVFFFFKDFYLFAFREREEERERNINVWCGCLLPAPYWGPGLHPRHVP